MKRIHRTLISAAIGPVLLGGSLAFAHNATLPAEQHQGNVAYVSSGVGKDEAIAFEKAAANYPLTLEFVGSQASRPRRAFQL